MTVFIIVTIINVFAFCLYGLDKYFAVKHKRRIREITLIGIAVIGGSVGALMGMLVFRHKLSKVVFRVWIPLAVCLHWGIFAYSLWKFKTVL